MKIAKEMIHTEETPAAYYTSSKSNLVYLCHSCIPLFLPPCGARAAQIDILATVTGVNQARSYLQLQDVLISKANLSTF